MRQQYGFLEKAILRACINPIFYRRPIPKKLLGVCPAKGKHPLNNFRVRENCNDALALLPADFGLDV
jgi:hypothetical protein